MMDHAVGPNRLQQRHHLVAVPTHPALHKDVGDGCLLHLEPPARLSHKALSQGQFGGGVPLILKAADPGLDVGVGRRRRQEE